jgi:hypothetical protein
VTDLILRATEAGFIVLENPAATGSIRVGRPEVGTDSTRAEMVALLEVSDRGEREREFSSNGG